MQNRHLFIGSGFVSLLVFAAVAIQLEHSPIAGGTSGIPSQVDPQTPRSASFILDCSAEAQPINPRIYGIGGSADPWATGTTARRSGGNPTTRYNWELDTWNLANDWYFKNTGGDSPGLGHERFLTENLAHHVTSALTLPIMGWVAKDSTSYSFPVIGLRPAAIHRRRPSGRRKWLGSRWQADRAGPSRTDQCAFDA